MKSEMRLAAGGSRFEAMGVELWTEEVSRAAGVGQELLDGHFCGDLFIWIVGEVFAHRIA